MKRSLCIATLVCACILQGEAQAKDFNMKPGKWQFTNTIQMPMLPAPQTTVNTECITKEDMKDPLAQVVDQGNCKVLDKKMKGDSIQFSLECNQEGMQLTGKGHFTANGKTASGIMEMTMDMPAEMANMPNMPAGQMNMTTTWEGKHIGKCD
jgi:hypothetical protein